MLGEKLIVQQFSFLLSIFHLRIDQDLIPSHSLLVLLHHIVLLGGGIIHGDKVLFLESPLEKWSHLMVTVINFFRQSDTRHDKYAEGWD